MKQVIQLLRMDNYWPLSLFALLALFTGGNYPLLLVAAAYAAGLMGYATLQSARSSGWEAQIMTMPVSRKSLVIGRYLQSICPACILGLLETAWYALGGRLDGYGLLLCGFALLVAAISLAVGFGEKGAQRTSGILVYGICGALFAAIPMRIGVDRDWFMPRRVPLDMATGMLWLAIGAVAVGLSLCLSLRLEAQREW